MAETDSSTIPTHPLDPPTVEEIERATGLIKEAMGKAWTERAGFCSSALVEPGKAELKTFKAGNPVSRKLRFLGYDYPVEQPDGGFDATVDLNTNDVVVSRITKGQAPIGFADVVNAVAFLASRAQ